MISIWDKLSFRSHLRDLPYSFSCFFFAEHVLIRRGARLEVANVIRLP